jgi:hypothetical protein
MTDETVQSTGTPGTPVALSTSHWYYLISNRTAASEGQSLLYALKVALDASSGNTWTVALAKVSGLYRAQLSHNSGSARTVTMTPSLAAALGFSSSSFSVAASTTVTAAYPSYWLWTPDRAVSATGPEMFDPAVSYGVPESAGASQRAPDMTVAYVQNGEQWSATYKFRLVEGYYRIRPQSGHTNEDVETWWRNGPALGRRILWWRDRDNATGSSAPSEGSSPAYNYIEYAPQESLRSKIPATAPVENNPYYWDVTFDLWLTDRGAAPLTD